MQPEVQTRLQHVLGAGAKIQRITAGKTFVDYTANEALPPAVERLFTIVGEALREAYRLDASIAARITEFPQHPRARVRDRVRRRRMAHRPERPPILLSEVRALLAESA